MCVGEDGVCFHVEKNMAERKMRFFGHIVRKTSIEKRMIHGKLEGKRGRGRPILKTWFQDLKKTGQG